MKFKEDKMRYEKGTDTKGNESYIDTRMGRFISDEEYEEATRVEDDGYDELEGEFLRVW
jgi:hypothetical protein